MKLILLAILLAFPLHSSAQQAHQPKHEYRAVWLTTIKGLDWPKEEHRADTAMQKAHLCAVLDSLQAIHVNTILLQTRVRGDLIYPSQIEPFAPVFTGRHGVGPGYDPLAFAIEECHRRGMQLHAWLVTIPLGDVPSTWVPWSRRLSPTMMSMAYTLTTYATLKGTKTTLIGHSTTRTVGA